MKKILMVLVCALSLTLTSCIGFGSLAHESVNKTEVVLQKNNYKIVKNVEGYTRSWYLFGIGGNSSYTLKENAVNEMFKNANLTGSQAIINISTTVSTHTIMGVYTERKVTAFGTVIEFTE